MNGTFGQMNGTFGQMNGTFGQYGTWASYGTTPRYGELAPTEGGALDAQLSQDIDACWNRYPRNLFGFITGRGKDRDNCINAANHRFEDRKSATAEVVETEQQHKKRRAEREQEARQALAAQQPSTVVFLAGFALVAAVAGTIYMTRPKKGSP
jgi:hypothetical protein